MAEKKNAVPVFGIVFGAIAVLIVVAVVLGGGSNDDDGEAIAFGEVEVTGTPLVRLADDGTDVSRGAPMPEASGADFAGNPVSITNDGRPKIILFLAHW